MHSLLALLWLGVAAVSASPLTIVGGNLTTIEQYPFQVALLFRSDFKTKYQGCGGSIINKRSILTAAHCVIGVLRGASKNLFVRVGSSFANSGGIIHNVEKCIVLDKPCTKDFAIVRLASPISFNEQAKPATFADANYNLGDNQTVWAAGWGNTSPLVISVRGSEQLRHVQIWTVDQAVCKDNYAAEASHYKVTDDMLCAGWLGVGGRGPCHGDSGSPLVHNGVVVGVTSWGLGCARADYPGVYARVSRVYDWIQANA